QSLRAAAERRVRDQQPRAFAVPRRDVRRAKTVLAEIPARSELRAFERRGRRLERTRSIHRSFVQLLRLEARLRAIGPRYPAQIQLLYLRGAAAADPG